MPYIHTYRHAGIYTCRLTGRQAYANSHTVIHTGIHTYGHHTYIHTHTEPYIHTYTYIPIRIHTYIPTHLHSYIYYAPINIHRPTFIQQYSQSYMHTYMHTVIQAGIRTHMLCTPQPHTPIHMTKQLTRPYAICTQ